MSRKATGPTSVQLIRDAYLAWLDAGCPLPGEPLVLPLPDDDPGWTPVLEVERRKVPATHRMVYRTYLDHARADGSESRPRAWRVARRSACSTDTVGRAMARHVDWGWAALSRPHAPFRSREYRMQVPDWWPELAAAYGQQSAPVRSKAERQSAPVRSEQSAPAGSTVRTGTPNSPHRLGGEPVEPVEPVFPRAPSPDPFTDDQHDDEDEDQQQQEEPNGEPAFTPDVAAYLADRFAARDPRAYWRRLSPIDQWRCASEVAGWKADRDRAERQAAEVAARRCPHGRVNGARLAADGTSVGGCATCEAEAVAS